MKLKLMPEYECSPVWSVTDGPLKNVPVEELAVDEQLREQLHEWDRRFQDTFDANYPPDSGFRDPQERAKFLADGESLAEQLCRYFEAVEYVQTDI